VFGGGGRLAVRGAVVWMGNKPPLQYMPLFFSLSLQYISYNTSHTGSMSKATLRWQRGVGVEQPPGAG
jgi:hypothetical protein